MFKKAIYILIFIISSTGLFCAGNSDKIYENIGEVEERAMVHPDDELVRNGMSYRFIGVTGAFGTGTKTPMGLGSVRFLYYPKSIWGFMIEAEYADYGDFGSYLCLATFASYKHSCFYVSLGPIFRIKLRNGETVGYYNYPEVRKFYSAHVGLGVTVGFLFDITKGRRPLKLTVAFDFKTGLFKAYKITEANYVAANENKPIEHYAIKIGIGF